jgi:hypothetical protein
MAEFLVEVYVARDDHPTARAIGQSVQADVAAVPGRSVRCLRSILVPEDETCLLLFEAPSAAAVDAAVRRAGLRPEHISVAES